jgi:hypothetical protein
MRELVNVKEGLINYKLRRKVFITIQMKGRLYQLTGEIRKYVSGMTNEVELRGFGRKSGHKSGINAEWDGMFETPAYW